MAHSNFQKGIQRLAVSACRLPNRIRPLRSIRSILMYHAIGTTIGDDSLGLYSMDPACFALHMQCLAKQHVGAIRHLAPDMLVTEQSAVSITFDDGYADNLHVALPILESLAIPCTIFVVSNAVAERKAGFLTPAELRRLAQSPLVQIGSHGKSHVRLAACSDTELRRELGDSKRYLEDLLGKEVSLLSYPHGSVDERVTHFAHDAGYVLATSSRFATLHGILNPLWLPRIDVWADDTSVVLEEKMRGDWNWLGWR